jgi:hypothetical protein
VSGFVEMVATWFVNHFTSDILLVFTESCSKRSGSFADILALRIFFTIILFTLPVVNAVLGFAVKVI